jgi:RNA polymerase sigma-70 factor, ECF subfamily
MVATETEALTSHFAAERRALLAHSYRMLGSWDEAEDAVQETYLRAWRGWSGFAGRSSVRVWLYRIATNACLTALAGRGRRALPSGLGGPSDDPAGPPDVAGPDTWIQPIPTSLLVADPAAVVTARESVRLALIAGLQYLPPRQRAVLLLREVLAFPAAEVAEMLGMTVVAVKSTLQRARARLDEVSPVRDDVAEPTEPRSRELLERYMAAWERSDVAAFQEILRADASLETVPARTWYAGKRTCVDFVRPFFGAPGDWRMVPTGANGQPAAATWFRGEPYGLAVLTPAPDGIARLTVFGDPALAGRFAGEGVS